MVVTQELVDNIKKQLEGLSPEEQQKKLQEIMAQLPPEDREQLMGGGGECPFCSMCEGKIPVNKVYEDDQVLAVLDINPANKGHIILFPKKHYQFLPQMEDKEISHLFKVANKLSGIVFETLEAVGTNLVVSNGPGAGQKSPHALVNIIPRFENDEVAIGWKPKEITKEELEQIANKINAKSKDINIKEENIVIKTEEVKEKKDFFDDIRIP